MKRVFYLFLALLLLLPLVSYSQFSSSNIPLTANLIYTTPSSISNHIFYLCVLVNGYVSIISAMQYNISISSVSTYIAGIGVPVLPLNGLVVSPPKVVGDKVFFIYIPHVTSISSNFNITRTILGYAIFNNSWSKVYNLISNGITEDFDIQNNTIYALWKPSHNSSSTYLLILTTSGDVIKNISIPNASMITVSGSLGIIGNVSVFQLTSFNFSNVSSIHGEYYVINLSNGKVLYQIPEYNGIEPSYVSVYNDTLLVSYSTNTLSYLVLYNLIDGKIISAKSFNAAAIGYIDRNFILVENVQRTSFSIISNIILFNTKWDEIYELSESSLTSQLLAEGLIVNSTSVNAIIVQINTQISFTQISITSSLEIRSLLQAPKPFTISVIQLHYNNYTILKISWNEEISSVYEVYLNNTLIANTTKEFIEYNVTTNSTYVIKVIAINAVGEVEETTIVNVTVYTIPSTTTSSTTTSTTTTTSATTTTSITESSSTVTQTTSTYSQTITSSTSTTTPSMQQSLKTTSIQIPETVYILVIIGIVIIVFLTRKK